MPYKDVRAETIPDLVVKVKAEIAKGFWPMEGGFIEEHDSNTPEKWVQMMVETKSIPPRPVVISNTAEQKIPILTTAAATVVPMSSIIEGGVIETGKTSKVAKVKKTSKAKKKTKAKSTRA